jgi:predicted ArsR family transcriptional regulator
MNLLQLIEQRPMLSAPEIADVLGVCQETVHKHLVPLLESGAINRKVMEKPRRSVYFSTKAPAWPAIERTLHRAKEVQSIFEYQPRASA